MSSNHGGVETVTKRFQNGDSYRGGWQGRLPEGHGCYTWKDGGEYEGGWHKGGKHGLGRYKWPSGATYQGEWQQGYMHGVGTFEAPEGTKYQGGWVSDKKHGLGKKMYANGDVYEGLWANNKVHGPGRYLWHDSNEYDGEWKNGLMHGRGSFKWKTSERYDGEWKEGQEDGYGVFTWADGSTFEGVWVQSQKHGVGVWSPPPQGHKHTTAITDGVDENANSEFYADDQSDGPLQAPALSRRGTSSPTPDRAGANPEQLFLREYRHAKLVRHEPISMLEMRELFSMLRIPQDVDQGQQSRGRLHGLGTGRQGKRAGELIERGHRSYQMMISLQLGIRWSVSKITPEMAPSEMTSEDFSLRVKQSFPHEGSPNTPPHPGSDFYWKDYCPMVFRKLRDIFGVDAADYMLSICGDQALRELSSPGKSGALFYISHDDRFFVKTVKKNEIANLLQYLPQYHEHTALHPHTLMTKFFGLHRISISGKGRSNSKLRFVVMGNVFNAELPLHRRYDLKGSTLGRTCGKNLDDEGVIAKDLDLDLTLKLEANWQERLTKQLDADCSFLEKMRVMDYSLLMGVHFRSRGGGLQVTPPSKDSDELALEERALVKRVFAMRLDEQRTKDLTDIIKNKLGHLQLRKKRASANMARSHTMRPAQTGAAEEVALALGQTRLELGAGMVATAMFKDGRTEDVVLYFGIIDFLQEYNLRKKMEHAFKALRHDGKEVSVINPTFYSKRFRAFMKQVFI